jgi:hypothetical protein
MRQDRQCTCNVAVRSRKYFAVETQKFTLCAAEPYVTINHIEIPHSSALGGNLGRRQRYNIRRSSYKVSDVALKEMALFRHTVWLNRP